MPEGVKQVRVKLMDSKNNTVLSKEIDVESGYKFVVDVVN